MYGKIRIKYCLLLLLCSCFSCENNYEDPYFIGEITVVKDAVKKTDILYPEKIVLNGAYYGSPAAYDSLLFFCNYKQTGCFFDVFNLKDGSLAGGFVPKGQGAGEVVAISPVYQFYKENDELKTLLFAPNERKLFLWNISQSLQRNETIYDAVIPYDWTLEHTSTSGRYKTSSIYNNISVMNNEEILAYVPARSTTIEFTASTLPHYQLRTLYSNELIRNYPVFKEYIASVNSPRFFSSSDCLKPDKSKIAQAMYFMPQINIIDLASGEVKGYRLDKSVKWPFNDKNTDILETPAYYTALQVTDQYIFALYSEGKGSEAKRPHILHIYNWEGELIRKIDLKGEFVADMVIDPVNNLLYTSNQTYPYEDCTDNIFCYDLNVLF